jgi:geranyl-CoA carboxylase alpha subunit
MTMFQKVLVANRGEIALRIIRTAQEMGYQTIAIYSDVDSNSPHVAAADEAVCIGKAIENPYLNIDTIVAAALRTKATLIHPGYGFLSENADFARACRGADLVYVGPSAKVIDLMGSKSAAKQVALDAGVPCIPGYQGAEQEESILLQEADSIGYPVMIKASFGGGGRGMRRVDDPTQFAAHLRSARSEAEKSFGNAELILEKALVDARHIEFQVLADSEGNVVHLGDRDCSVQRRHQKVLEESPSPFVDTELRTRMGESAVQLARACGYEGVGTVEYLVDTEGQFYFLEMNTRLQVEHPVTEMVSGLDLVAWQFKVATGYTLPFTQADLQATGHAIELRLCAEDPANASLPQTGKIQYWRPATGAGIRVDSGIETGTQVTSHYDSMLGKIIAWGEDRRSALQNLHRALKSSSLLGLQTNKSHSLSLLESEPFVQGNYTTAAMEQIMAGLTRTEQPQTRQLALRIAAMLIHHSWLQGGYAALVAKPRDYLLSNQLSHQLSDQLSNSAQQHSIEVSQLESNAFSTLLDESRCDITLLSYADNICTIVIDGLRQSCAVAQENQTWFIECNDEHFTFELMLGKSGIDKSTTNNGQLVAAMDGVVVEVLVEAGAEVSEGQLMMVLESMKMETPLVALRDGVVERIEVSKGDSVNARQILAVMT